MFFALAIALSSCSEKEELVTPVAIKLDGTWKIDEYKTAKYTNGTLTQANTTELTNAGTIVLNSDKTGRINIVKPGVGIETFNIVDWSNTTTTIQIISNEAGSTINDTVNYELIVNEQVRQEWFNAAPSKTNTNRLETSFKLSPL